MTPQFSPGKIVSVRPVHANGCYDRAPYAKTLQVQDGWTETGSRRMVEIEGFGRQECAYSESGLGQTDPACSGCKWRAQA
jgi:hypothetical protein